MATRQHTISGLANVAGWHSAWLGAGYAALAIVVVGGVVAIVLVVLVPREHRVEAIRAAADLVAALLPWSGRRDHR
jgi:hypothetical protein